jgi:heme-degrading monooxygenase HmoA
VRYCLGMPVARIWRTQIDVARSDDYERFVAERSLPMFKQQVGFEGVLFLRSGADCAVVTLWRDREAVSVLEESHSYNATASALGASGILAGEASLEVLDLHGAELGAVRH